ncbi:hypothetical protein J6590_062091 [Homalodisca vitripennis]|nr:hypothetical protein J6590_062091 [Homalodisca vitripennis]
MYWVRRLSQDNQIKQRRAWLLLGQVTSERSCPCKRPVCPAIGGGSEVTFKPLVPRLSVREGFLALTSPDLDGHTLITTLHMSSNIVIVPFRATTAGVSDPDQNNGSHRKHFPCYVMRSLQG